MWSRAHHQVNDLVALRDLEIDPGAALALLVDQPLQARELVLFQMQAYAACSDEDVRSLVRRRWDGMVKLVTELTGAERPELNLFLARGMLMNVVASIGLVPAKAADRWGHEVLGFA